MEFFFFFFFKQKTAYEVQYGLVGSEMCIRDRSIEDHHMIPIKTESAFRGTADCRACGIRDMVLFADLREEDFNLIHAPIDDLEYGPGQPLVRVGDTAPSLYTPVSYTPLTLPTSDPG